MGAVVGSLLRRRPQGSFSLAPRQEVLLWATAEPPVRGGLGCWQFASGAAEAAAIAVSWWRLIDAGMNPRDIMILLASTRTQAFEIQAALEEHEVPYEPVRESTVADTDAGRAGYAALSIVVEPENYLATACCSGYVAASASVRSTRSRRP